MSRKIRIFNRSTGNYIESEIKRKKNLTIKDIGDIGVSSYLKTVPNRKRRKKIFLITKFRTHNKMNYVTYDDILRVHGKEWCAGFYLLNKNNTNIKLPDGSIGVPEWNYNLFANFINNTLN